MKQMLRLMSTMLLVVVVLVGVVLPATAQDDPWRVNCNGLSPEDCQILTDATAAMGTMQSFTVPAWAFGLNMTAGEETITMAGNGSARMVMAPALAALLTDLPAGQMDMEALMALYQKITAEFVLDMLDNTGGELVIDNLNVDVPDEEPVNLSGMQLIYKNRGVYMHAPSPTGATAWFGEEFEITPEMMEEMETAIAEFQAEVTVGMDDPEFLEALAQMDQLTALMTPLYDLASAHTTTVRGADVDMMGQTMYPFTTTVDLVGFLNDPQLAGTLLRVLNDPLFDQAAGDQMQELGVNEGQLQLALALVATVFKVGTITSTTVVGAQDGLVHQMGMELVLDLNLAILNDPAMPGVQINMGYEVSLDAINTTTLDDLALPTAYHALDMVDGFLMGYPDMIDATVALGDTFSGEMGWDGDTHMLALPLAAGDAVTLTLVSDNFPYVNVYGPDGFLVAEFDTYYDDEMAFTAKQGGTYIITVESGWDMTYDLTIAAQ